MKRRIMLIASVAIASTSAASMNAQSIRGTVFDSLTMKPLGGASVWIQGAAQTTVADSLGHFALVGVSNGNHFIAFSSPSLDSLGLGTFGAQVRTQTGLTQTMLATPSFKSMFGVLCKNTVASSDSGIVWGVVRDAETDVRLSNARTVLEWTVPSVTGNKQVSIVDGSRELRTDSTGTYYACGVPIETEFNAQATGKQTVSGIVQQTIGARRVLRLDLLVSKEFYAFSAPDSGQETNRKATGSARIRGTVTDDKGRPAANATVSVAFSEMTAQTDGQGRFQINGLPAGTNTVDVRQIGFAPLKLVADLRPNATVDVMASLLTLSRLDAVKVTAAIMATRDRDDFEKRRREGFGYAITQKDLVGVSQVTTALQLLPNLRLNKVRGQLEIYPPKGNCKVKVWMDGRPSNFDEIMQLNIEDVRAIEWYTHNVPMMLMSPCAALVIWTARSRWGS